MITDLFPKDTRSHRGGMKRNTFLTLCLLFLNFYITLHAEEVSDLEIVGERLEQFEQAYPNLSIWSPSKVAAVAGAWERQLALDLELKKPFREATGRTLQDLAHQVQKGPTCLVMQLKEGRERLEKRELVELLGNAIIFNYLQTVLEKQWHIASGGENVQRKVMKVLSLALRATVEEKDIWSSAVTENLKNLDRQFGEAVEGEIKKLIQEEHSLVLASSEHLEILAERLGVFMPSVDSLGFILIPQKKGERVRIYPQGVLDAQPRVPLFEEVKPFVKVLQQKEQVGQYCARALALRVQANNAQSRSTVLGLTSDNSLQPLYRELRRMFFEENLDLSNLTVFYLNQPSGEKELDLSLLKGLLWSEGNPRGIRRERVYFPPNGKGEILSSAKEESEKYDSFIEKMGPIDFHVMGLNSFSFVQDKKSSQSHLASSFHQEAVMKSKEVWLLVNGEEDISSIESLIEGPMDKDIPLSNLRKHPSVIICLDKELADSSSCLGRPCGR